jgi:hypothetical protein
MMLTLIGHAKFIYFGFSYDTEVLLIDDQIVLNTIVDDNIIKEFYNKFVNSLGDVNLDAETKRLTRYLDGIFSDDDYYTSGQLNDETVFISKTEQKLVNDLVTKFENSL